MDLFEAILRPLTSVFDPSERVFWLHICTALAIALVIFVVSQGRKKRLSQFFSFCFPKYIWRHRSTHNDIAYFAINRIIFAVFFSPFVILIYPTVNRWIYQFLINFGPSGIREAPVYVLLGYGVIALAVFDFSIYVAHLALHKSPFLWQFHKVHHSAETLNPFTAYRTHPVDDVITLMLGALMASVAHAIFSFFWADSFSSLQLAVTGIAVMIFYLLGYNLRHSHIWLSYGSTWSRLLISPAQHQIHHSREIRHQDKNLGFILSIWDGVFGTLYVPKHKEEFRLGLSDQSENSYHNPLACYLKPFQENFSAAKWKAAVTTAALVGISAVSVGAQSGDQTVRAVFLEELTTTEVESYISSGWRSVIIPTGGVEQNGQHVVLGKHNLVVRNAAEKIAHELGHTLVAPVIAYVPQGEVNPPEQHMRFAGTLSVRESTFKAILEDTTRSLVQHGFTNIYYVGDSGGNQLSQAEVAAAFQEEYDGTEISVMHVGDYYDNNGQIDWLRAQGYTDKQIGWHAGLRDSSEVLYVAPQSIRDKAIRLSARHDGVSGAYWKASETIGKSMIDLKVEAALRQIRGTDE